MENQETLLTEEGLKKLENELENLISVKRLEVAQRIKTAIEYGDLSENSEYDDAKNEQAFVEGRIKELEKMIRTAKIIEGSKRKNKVSVGSTVTLFDEEFKDEMVYTIVGSSEADPFNNRISNESPVGKALIGQKKNATVKVATPDGETSYKILAIK